ncbi:hypothetical protein CPB83DRAFT_862914 [Crepidotus variabilis]|uniref:Uncharacterized protein n=1 Tax=Crepidotus variabilis TaxID=179855 RepID=A0A9P6E6C4_9AGAR|nr:hypothetical protein CPB83DRAFT_862914 [Crepidotus variabilis]
MEPLPQEIIDLIIDSISSHNELDNSPTNPTLFTCTRVSRSFWMTARKHIFSKLIFCPTSTLQNTKDKLTNLAELLEQDKNLLSAISFVEINTSLHTTPQWAYQCDEFLDRILILIINRPRKLNQLSLFCFSNPILETTFGKRTQENIKHLVTGLEALSLAYLEISATFFEKLPPLKHLHLMQVTLASPADSAHFPLPKFQPNATMKIDYGSLEHVHDLYQGSQLFPGYTNLKVINTFSHGSTSQLREMLDGGVNTMTSLELNTNMSLPPKGYHIDLGHFKKLTYFLVSILCLSHSWTITEIIDSISLHFDGAVGLFDPSSSPSHLVDLEISLACYIEMQLTDVNLEEKIDSTVSTLKEGLSGLASCKLLAQHPQLKSVKLKITLPTPSNSDVEKQAINNYKNFFERCIKDAVAAGDGPLKYVVQIICAEPT